MSALLATLLACSAPSDGELFTRAALASSLAEGLAACERIDGPAVSSECRAQLVRERGAEDLDLAGVACAEAADPAWRDECRFLLAEVALRERGHEAATRLCVEAGSFQGQCLKHLWDKLAASLKRDLALPTAVLRYGEDLERVGVQDAELLGQAWGVFFRSELPLSGPLQVEDCGPLPDPHAGLCRAGLREAVKRHVAQAVEGRGVEAWQPACVADDAAQRAEIVQELAVIRYHPRGLDPFVREGLRAACKAGPPTP